MIPAGDDRIMSELASKAATNMASQLWINAIQKMLGRHFSKSSCWFSISPWSHQNIQPWPAGFFYPPKRSNPPGMELPWFTFPRIKWLYLPTIYPWNIQPKKKDAPSSCWYLPTIYP
jgi:hypothetical protein